MSDDIRAEAERLATLALPMGLGKASLTDEIEAALRRQREEGYSPDRGGLGLETLASIAVCKRRQHALANARGAWWVRDSIVAKRKKLEKTK